LWELDVKAFRKSASNKNPLSISKYIGTFKCYQNAVHYCEFSPNGLHFFAGSDDGTAKIWKIDKGKVTPCLSDEKLQVTLQEKL
jgi:WD40 repeat protein